MDSQAFKTWWEREGSGMRPLEGEDAEMHVHRICTIAWSNGEFVMQCGMNAQFKKIMGETNYTCHFDQEPKSGSA